MTGVEGQFSEVDVSEWVHAHEETLGTKPKRWLQDPSTQTYWLMKDRTFNKRSDGSRYPKGDDWAERVAAAIAQQMGLPCAHVDVEELVAVIYLLPEHRMAEPSKQFAERLLRRNHGRLLSYPFGTV